jgi:hypothetical protein
MSTGPNASFQPSRVVTGQEALDVISRIEALIPGVVNKPKNVR